MVDIVDLFLYSSFNPLEAQMQLIDTKPLKETSEGMPSRRIMSTLKTFNRVAKTIDGLPKQTFMAQLREKGTPLDVEELLREAVVAEGYLKKIRETLEEKGALLAVKRQLAQGQIDFESMIDKKILVEPSEFARDMHWTRQALSKALNANRVFYIEHKGCRYYPKFFADAHYERRQLESVCQVLGELPGASKWQFMSTPKGSLEGKTPLSALKAGMFSRVKVAAEGFVQR